MRAQCFAAAWQAECDYDPSRGVPLCAFVYARVLNSALIRYRQEWSYAAHCLGQAPAEGQERVTAEALSLSVVQQLLWSARAQLPDLDQWLIEQLFWEGHTEAELAVSLGISQQAVSKRKRAVLRELRRWLEKAKKI